MKKKISIIVMVMNLLVISLAPSASASNSIQDAYKTILNQYISEWGGEWTYYTLFDIDNNGTKELIVDFGGSDGSIVYGYNNGVIKNYDHCADNVKGYYQKNNNLYVMCFVLQQADEQYVTFEMRIDEIVLNNNTILHNTIYYNPHYIKSINEVDKETERNIPEVAEFLNGAQEIEFLNIRDYSLIETNEIKIVLNGKKIEFDQSPIMVEDRILVPIRKIAEAMGDTVLWNDEYQTAFIKHKDRGLIIKLLEDNIKIVENEQWTQWKEKELDVMAFSLNGRTLVPIRAFCESLGAAVNWNNDEYTAYITYDFNKDIEEMRSETFKNINTVYYALNNDDVPFDSYSDDFNFFYDNRNRQKDAIKMGVSDIWAGVNDLLSGLSNSENIMKNSFEQMLAVIPDNSIVSIDTELLDDLKAFADNGKYIFDEINGIDDEFLELHPKLKLLDTSIEVVGRAYDIMSFSTEQIAIFLSNYETNISYIEQLRSILQENNLLDDSLNTSLIVLQQEYSDKFFKVMLNTRDELEKFNIMEGTNLATGGLFSVGVFTWEQLFKLSGITDDGQALKTFYGLYCINGCLDIAYNQAKDKIIKGYYTPSDVEDLKMLDDLQRALKIKNYQCIKTISQDSDTHSLCDEYIAQLSKSCISWKTE